MKRNYLFLVSVSSVLWTLFMNCASAFPSGAPVEACESLLPRHVQTKPSPPNKSPYTFVATANRYYPDSRRRNIQVKIGGAAFKGFLVVALDADTHDRIGTWVESRGMESLPCSGVTHTDSRSKIGATMVWKPPPDRKSGEVIFLGTILESFSSYYSGLVASVPAKKRVKQLRRMKTTSTEAPAAE